MKLIPFLLSTCLIFVIICSSCSYKRIVRSSTYYRYTEPMGSAGVTPTLEFYANSPCLAKIEDKGDHLVIIPKDPPTNNGLTTIPAFTGAKCSLVDKYYFPEDTHAATSTSISYWDLRPVLQALSIPIKVRPELKGAKYSSLYPSQAESGLNVGLAFGGQLRYNTWRNQLNQFGKHSTVLSMSSGIFVGTSATDLKKTNTLQPTIEVERKAALISPGLFFIGGYNNLNIGYALGVDFATGVGAPGWAYQGKLWHGIIVALDIVKF